MIVPMPSSFKIGLRPSQILRSRIIATHRNAPRAASRQRHVTRTGALTEDNSVRSIPSLTANLRISRSLSALAGPDSALTLDVFNLFDRRVDDIQYVYASQPRGLAAQVDRHVHPAEPRSLRLTLRWGF